MEGMTRKKFIELLEEKGAEIKKSVTKAVTHLITTKEEVEKPTVKVKQAQKKNIPVVSQNWASQCIEKKEIVAVKDYLLCQMNSDSKADEKPKKKTGKKKKRAEGDDGDDTEPPTKKRKLGAKKKKKGRCGKKC